MASTARRSTSFTRTILSRRKCGISSARRNTGRGSVPRPAGITWWPSSSTPRRAAVQGSSCTRTSCHGRRRRPMEEWESHFIVYPAIDLRGGRCVRLKQGDFGRSKEYDADPIARAREWERQGAQAIHIVDLDGARAGRPVQLGLISHIARAVGIPLQVGGGVRTIEDLRAVREAGARRTVMGTAAVEDRDLRMRAVEEAGDSLVVAVDAM